MRLIAAAILLALAAPAAAETTVIHAGRLIVDAAKPARGASTIIVENGRIARIEDGTTADPAGATVVDLSGKTVMPGLIDAHVHLGGNAGEPWYVGLTPRRTAAYSVAVGLHNALITARAGFTTLRELGGDERATIAVRDAIADGLEPGPRILTAGTPLSMIGGHADPFVGLNPDIAGPAEREDGSIGVCTGVDGCAAAVRRIARDGVDVIKFMATGGVLDDGAKGLEQHFTDAEMKSICDTAHSLGLKVAAHAHGARGIEAAVRAGVDSIEHGTFADATDIALMKQRGTYFVPTMMALTGVDVALDRHIFTPNMEAKARYALSVRGRALAAAYKAGVPIALGTDAGVYQHGKNAGEIGEMVKWGHLTPRDALIAGTSGAARLLGVDKETGTLDPGKSADLIAVDGDPLTDPAAVLHVGYVMVKGQAIPMK